LLVCGLYDGLSGVENVWFAIEINDVVVRVARANVL
jgi:hypothetical protein